MQTIDNLPYNLIDTVKGQGGQMHRGRVRRLGAVHDAGRRQAVHRRARPPGDAPDRRPPADDRQRPERLRLARQRPLRAVRPGVRQGPAPARAGHRPGQVAAQGGRPGGPPGPALHRRRHRLGGTGAAPRSSSSRPRRPASTSRSSRRTPSTATTTSPTRSPRTSGTPALPPAGRGGCRSKGGTYNETHWDNAGVHASRRSIAAPQRRSTRPSATSSSRTPRRSSTTRAATSSGASAPRSTPSRRRCRA